MPQLCTVSGEPFEIHSQEALFLKQRDLPLPHKSPRERLRERFAFRHGGQMFRTKCDGTGKEIIAAYPSERNFPVYDQAYWWSDAWSAASYGREYDFSRSFFEQFAELRAAVPRISLLNTSSENSYYTSHGLNQKNCYLIVGGADNEDCLYGYYIISCKDVVDSLSMHHCELCYDGVSSFECYDCRSLSNCRNCTSCIMIDDCRTCTNCIACVGLNNQTFYILNRKVSESEYKAFRDTLSPQRLIKLRSQFERLRREVVHPATHLYKCEDCSGDLLVNCKNSHYCFDSSQIEDCRYLAFAGTSAGSIDCSFNGGGGVRFSYHCVSTLATDSHHCAIVWHCNDAEYSMDCHNCSNIFGCSGMQRANFCILNRTYPEPEYRDLRARIVQQMKANGEWGKFFPGNLSPYAYNDSVAALYLPLTAEAARAQGYRWRDEEDLVSPRDAASVVIPERIEDTEDTICDQTLRCEKSWSTYRIVQRELAFYRKLGISPPRFCPRERHLQRLSYRHHFTLYPRCCEASGAALLSPYSESDVPRVVDPECAEKIAK